MPSNTLFPDDDWIISALKLNREVNLVVPLNPLCFSAETIQQQKRSITEHTGCLFCFPLKPAGNETILDFDLWWREKFINQCMKTPDRPANVPFKTSRKVSQSLVSCFCCRDSRTSPTLAPRALLCIINLWCWGSYFVMKCCLLLLVCQLFPPPLLSTASLTDSPHFQECLMALSPEQMLTFPLWNSAE